MQLEQVLPRAPKFDDTQMQQKNFIQKNRVDNVC